MNDVNVELPVKNFPAQQTIFDSPKRYKIVVKGRRFGLTRGAVHDFIISALRGTFKKGLWVDTVNPNLDRYVERYFIPALMKLPQSLWQWRKQARILHIKDSYIDFRSADRPENLEGYGYDKVFLNEAGIILRDEYLWHNAIKPMLWDYNAPALIGGTPKGKGIFFQLAEKAKVDRERYDLFHFTTFDNPYLDRANLEQEITDMPERAIQQEIYAQFLEDTGVVFRNVQAVATAKPEKPLDNHLYVIGIDLAKVQDFTVLAVYDRTTNCQVYQDRFNTLEWPFQKKKIIEIAKHYKNALCLIDASGVGDPIVDDLLRSGVAVEPVKFTNELKKEFIEKLVIWIEQGKIRILNIPETISELNAFTYEVTGTGRIRYEAPAGLHDDIVIAHALAVHGLFPLYMEEPRPKELSRVQQTHLRQIHNIRNIDNQAEWEEWSRI